MAKKHARFKPFTFWVTDLADYEGFIELLNNAGFEIREEDWQYTMTGMLLTFPMRDHALQFRNVMSGRDIEGIQVSIIRANTQKEGPDTRNPVNAVPTEAAILDAFRDKYGPSNPLQATISRPAIVQSSSLTPLRHTKEDGAKADGEEDEEEEEEVEAKGGGKDIDKPPKSGSPEPKEEMDVH